jgi:hypothetical protein
MFASGRARAGELDSETRSILETIIKAQAANRSRIKDMTMRSTRTERISVDDKIRDYYHIAIEYYQLGRKERVDSKHFEDSKVDDSLKEHTSKWVFTGDKTLSYWEGTTLCSVSVPEDYMKLRTDILEEDSSCPDFRTFMEEIRSNISRFDPGLDDYEVTTITRDDRKLPRVVYTTMRGGKGTDALLIDPARGYEVINSKRETYLRDGRLWILKNTDYEIAEVVPGAWRPVGCKIETKELDTSNNKWIHAEQAIETHSYEANTGKIDDSYFTFEGLGVPPGTPIADLTFEPPIEYIFKAAPISEADLEALWSDVQTDTNQDSTDQNVGSEGANAPSISKPAPTQSEGNNGQKAQESENSGSGSGPAFLKPGNVLALAAALIVGFWAGFWVRRKGTAGNRNPISQRRTVMSKRSCFLSLLYVCAVVCTSASSWARAGELDSQTRSILETIIKAQAANRSRIEDMTMRSTRTERISVDDKIRDYYHIGIEYYQLGRKERVDTKHFEDSKVDDLLKEHTSKWVFTGDKTLSFWQGTTLCSVSVPEDYMKLATDILEIDVGCPDYRTFMEQLRHNMNRFDPALDDFEVTTVSENDRKLLRLVYTTMRGGKGTDALLIDPARGASLYSKTHITRSPKYSPASADQLAVR